jgi:integrase
VLAELSPVTASKYLSGLRQLPSESIAQFATSKPQDVRSFWKLLDPENTSYAACVALKSLLTFQCRFRVGKWTPESHDIVSQLPLPKRDKYRSVRVGDVFLTAAEEAELVRHIDSVCERVRLEPATMPRDVLEATGMLVCSYQFGLRAKQIAMLEMRGIRIWRDDLGESPAVHLTFTMIKQRSAKKVFPMVRRVKREWAPIFVNLFNDAKVKGLSGADRVFQRTPVEVWQAVADLTEAVAERRRTTRELRHSAAQRLVDAGASEEELAAFMGHSDLDTGLIYFRSSSSQGERVNKALGISGIYRQVARIAHARFISAEELLDLKGEQQVAGVPHGIPIAGIGGCTSGQPSCSYNPVLSCYGCSKFMPLADAGIHKRVMEDLRAVVKLFYTSSRAQRGSPAFQLEETIAKVQAVITELGAETIELLP